MINYVEFKEKSYNGWKILKSYFYKDNSITNYYLMIEKEILPNITIELSLPSYYMVSYLITIRMDGNENYRAINYDKVGKIEGYMEWDFRNKNIVKTLDFLNHVEKEILKEKVIDIPHFYKSKAEIDEYINFWTEFNKRVKEFRNEQS